MNSFKYISVVLALTLVGCNNGNGNNTDTSTKKIYNSGMTICVDSNNNLICDREEIKSSSPLKIINKYNNKKLIIDTKYDAQTGEPYLNNYVITNTKLKNINFKNFLLQQSFKNNISIIPEQEIEDFLLNLNILKVLNPQTDIVTDTINYLNNNLSSDLSLNNNFLAILTNKLNMTSFSIENINEIISAAQTIARTNNHFQKYQIRLLIEQYIINLKNNIIPHRSLIKEINENSTFGNDRLWNLLIIIDKNIIFSNIKQSYLRAYPELNNVVLTEKLTLTELSKLISNEDLKNKIITAINNNDSSNPLINISNKTVRDVSTPLK